MFLQMPAHFTHGVSENSDIFHISEHSHRTVRHSSSCILGGRAIQSMAAHGQTAGSHDVMSCTQQLLIQHLCPAQALNYPNKPAVILFNYWTPWLGDHPGSFWENAEADFSEFSLYVGVFCFFCLFACWYGSSCFCKFYPLKVAAGSTQLKWIPVDALCT